MHVLVVDDSALSRRILVGILQQECEIAKVEEAEGGEEAIAKWQEQEFDLIMLDWLMPDLSGIEVLHKIRAQDKKTPIIMVTTESEQKQVFEALHGGATDYIIKPVTRKIVSDKVDVIRKRAIHEKTSQASSFQAASDHAKMPPTEGE